MAETIDFCEADCCDECYGWPYTAAGISWAGGRVRCTVELLSGTCGCITGPKTFVLPPHATIPTYFSGGAVADSSACVPGVCFTAEPDGTASHTAFLHCTDTLSPPGESRPQFRYAILGPGSGPAFGGCQCQFGAVANGETDPLMDIVEVTRSYDPFLLVWEGTIRGYVGGDCTGDEGICVGARVRITFVPDV